LQQVHSDERDLVRDEVVVRESCKNDADMRF